MSSFLKLRWNTTILGDDEVIFKIASLINQCDFVDERPVSYFKDDSNNDIHYRDVYVMDTTKPINVVMNKHAEIISQERFDYLNKVYKEEEERRSNGEAA